MSRLKENSYVGLRMENKLLELVHSYARDHGIGVSAAVRALVMSGIERDAERQAKRTKDLVSELKKSTGQIFMLKAVGEGLALERVKPGDVDLGVPSKKAGRKKELANV